MRFTVDPPERLTDQRASLAYVTGLDRIPWPTRARIERTPDGEPATLLLERLSDDSGSVNIPWPVEGFGELMLCTGILRERAEPYRLPLELARGTVNLLRNQLAEWQAIRLSVPPEVHEKTAEAIDRLAWAAVRQDEAQQCTGWADEAIALAVEAGRVLAGAYVDQSMAVRRRGGGRLPVLLGSDLGGALLDEHTSTMVLRGFNAANVPLQWRDLEASEGTRQFAVPDRQIHWCKTHGMRCFAGPLLRLDAGALPDWLTLWEGDFENVVACASEFIEAVVTRYRGKVDVWQCAGRVNTGEALDLSEQEQLQLAAQTIELVAKLDPDRPRLISFDQPWGEYMGHRRADFPPLHMADALVRAGMPISGIGLEINVGLTPGGTRPRTTLELSHLLDQWNTLGLPLHVFVSAPSSSEPDPRSRRQPADTPRKWTTRAQQVWVARNVTMMVAKPYVASVFWNQLLDTHPHQFPHAGLFDHQNRPKPALRTLAALRRTHLK